MSNPVGFYSGILQTPLGPADAYGINGNCCANTFNDELDAGIPNEEKALVIYLWAKFFPERYYKRGDDNYEGKLWGKDANRAERLAAALAEQQTLAEAHNARLGEQRPIEAYADFLTMEQMTRATLQQQAWQQQQQQQMVWQQQEQIARMREYEYRYQQEVIAARLENYYRLTPASGTQAAAERPVDTEPEIDIPF